MFPDPDGGDIISSPREFTKSEIINKELFKFPGTQLKMECAYRLPQGDIAIYQKE